MAAIEVGSECGKLRSSARISNVKSYSENFEKVDEFLGMDEASKNLRPQKRAKISKKNKGNLVSCEISESLTKDPRPKKRARVSKIKDKLVPSEIQEISTKDRRPKKRAKMSIKKKDELISCETLVGEIKTNVTSNAEKKFFPIFTSSPKLQIKQILSPEKISIDTEPKIDFDELAEKSSQNHINVYQTKINKINGSDCNENVLLPVEKQKEVASDVKEDSKVISDITSAICIKRTLVKNEEVLETDKIPIDPDKINTKNDPRQDSYKKVNETPTTNGNCSDFINTSSEDDKLMPLKKKRKKKNVKGNIGKSNSFLKIKSECKILNKANPSTTDKSKSPEINNEMKIKVTKPTGAVKLFPIFSSSHNLVKTSKSSPEDKEKNKPSNDVCVQQTKHLLSGISDDMQTEQLSDDITDNVQPEQLSDDITDNVQPEQLSDDVTDFVQTEQLSDDVTDGVQTELLPDDVTDGVQTEQLSNDITDGVQTEQLSNGMDCVQTMQLSNDSANYVQTEQPSIMKDDLLATCHELSNEIIVDESVKVVDHNPVSVIHPVRTRRKRKLNKSDDSAAVNSVRITRSQTIKSNSNVATSLPCTESDNEATKKCDTIKKKLQRNKTKTDALKLLAQSHQCLKKKKKDSTDLKKINPTKLFPLFSKSQIAVVEKKSVSQLNSLAKKKMKDNAKTAKSSRNSVAHDSVDDLFEENNTNDGKIKTKNNRKMKNNSKVLKKKNSDLELLEISDDSIVEVTDTDNFKAETNIAKQSESADIESMNKTETVVEKNTTLPRKKGNNVSSKAPEMCLSFPLITQCYALDKEFEASVSKHFLREDDTSSEMNIPLWNKMVGLTDIKSIDEADMVSPTQNIDEISQTENVNEINNILWTDISNDYNLKEGVSESSISDLNMWLSQWKSRFTKKDKSKHNDSDDSFDSFSSDSNDSEAEGLSNSIIIMGPPGCGKTSLVFSLANDHGFKVLEVNASSCRNGRNISHQLKEALESYHVENIRTAGVNFQKVTCEEYNEDDALTKPKKIKMAKKGITDYLQKEKKSDEGKTMKKKSTMKNFFQVKSVTKNSDESQKLKKTVSEQHKSTTACTNDSSSSRSISTRTIILFDDIDVVFQEDEGLWSTIRNFLKISKKPVIFTVSRNLAVVKANLDSDITVLHLKPMVEEVAIEKINDQYETYGRKNSNINTKLLVNNSRDVRRNLLHAQFWSQPCDLHPSIKSNEKVFSTNTFFLGSLNFNAMDFIPLILKNKLLNCYLMISEYHKIGYDLLHSNLFTILNGTDIPSIVRSWKSVIKRTGKYDRDFIESLDTKREHANGIGESDLWKEACEIFELKKQRLQKGTSSDDLFIFSNVLEHFSFADSLKGCFYKNMKWISQPERNRMWNQGLPACSEESDFRSDDSILDMVSLIQMLGLQLAQNKYSTSSEFQNDDNKMLVLEHPFMNNDDGNEIKVDVQLESISSEFSASHMLNKMAFNLDYFSTLKIMCQEELLRRTKSGKRSNRFLHYFDSISLYIDKSQIEKCVE